MNDHIQHKEALVEEFEELTKELTKLGVQDVQDPSSWSVKNPDLDILSSDENEVADRSEEMQIDTIILDELTARYNNITRALTKIENDTYGACELCGNPVEEDRLSANPAARTCKEHIGQEENVT